MAMASFVSLWLNSEGWGPSIHAYCQVYINADPWKDSCLGGKMTQDIMPLPLKPMLDPWKARGGGRGELLLKVVR